jgi:4-hydroxy-3-polyprenylbenzoate decarboxylase
MRLVVAISGASGAIYGIRTLEALKMYGVESHLILSKWAEATIKIETSYSLEDVKQLATVVYSSADQAAKISSGSFHVDGMIIAPCSMKTLSSVAHGLAVNLVSRAADVTLKERRKLVMVPRETPFNDIHLENMLKLSRMGVVMLPPVPGFYNHPKTIDDIVNHTIARILDQFHIENNLTTRWKENVKQSIQG